jgi:RNA polymerase sigma factor
VGVLSFRRKKTETSHDLSTLIHKARANDERARNEILEMYIPFVLRVVSQASHRYIDKSRDDEFSIGLLALNEAIDKIDVERLSTFLGFAETVIRRRLIDYFRTQKSRGLQVPWSEFDREDDDNQLVNFVEVKTSIDAYQRAEEIASRALEIADYEIQLQKFSLSFAELVTLSPKHEDARLNALAVARLVTSEENLLTYVFQRKSLPLKDIEQKVSVSRKTLERQRKYILAMIILIAGDYPLLQAFLS